MNGYAPFNSVYLKSLPDDRSLWWTSHRILEQPILASSVPWHTSSGTLTSKALRPKSVSRKDSSISRPVAPWLPASAQCHAF